MPEESVDGTVAPPIEAAPPGRSHRAVTPAVAGALVVLAASFALSVAFVLANGGLDLPAAARGPGSSGSPGADGLTATASPTATASSTSTAAPTASASAAPSVAPEPSPTAATKPTVGPTGSGSASRYELLTACPATPDCWVYVVRSGRQPGQHRQLLRRPAARGRAAQPVDRRHPVGGRSEAVAAGADPLGVIRNHVVDMPPGWPTLRITASPDW